MLQRQLNELLDISDEDLMLNEMKDVHSELEMIGSIFDTQIQVLYQLNTSPMPPAASKKLNKIIEAVRQRRGMITEMDESAQRTLKAIQSLFDAKQRQTMVLQVLELHFSRRMAQDSGRQATTVLIFTVATIVFLPLSFITSFFAIPVKEFPRDKDNAVEFPLSWVSVRLFGIAGAIAVAIVGLAFGINAAIKPLPAASWRRRV
jgi:Mg2+ and Co2+ transporter CorA